MARQTVNSHLISGGLMLGLGAVSAGYAAINYGFGKLSFLGPGAFPVLVGTALALVGAIMLLTARRAVPDDDAPQGADLGMLARTMAGISAFAAMLHLFGAIPAVFALVGILMIDGSAASVRHAAATATCLAIVAIVLFGWMLHVRFDPLRWPL